MKKMLLIPASLPIIFIIWFFILGVISKSASAPGFTEEKLSPCSDKPNCVCSERQADTRHYIKPIIFPKNTTLDILPSLKSTIQDMKRNVHVVKQHYIAATFSSPIFGFVDDFEVRKIYSSESTNNNFYANAKLISVGTY